MFGDLSTLSLDLILFLQQPSPHRWLDEAAVFITMIGDPKLIFLYVAPLIVWLHTKNRTVGIDVFVGLVLSDWLNAVFKWPFAGDRPYWYDDRVKEFSVTCESGFGMPSGHVMVSSTVAYILVSHVPHGAYRRFARSFATIFIILIGFTRMYVGAHFLEQVILGGVAGVATGWLVIHYQFGETLIHVISRLLLVVQAETRWRHCWFWRSVILGTAIIATVPILIPILEFAIISYWRDPLHSVTLAREGCEATRSSGQLSPEELAQQVQFQLERGPFIGVVRDAGVALGGLIGLVVILACTKKRRLNERLQAPSSAEQATATTCFGLISSANCQAILRLLLRGVIGLGSTHVFKVMIGELFNLPPMTWLAPLLPALFVYVKNYLIFGLIAFHYLALAPLLMMGAEHILGLKHHYE